MGRLLSFYPKDYRKLDNDAKIKALSVKSKDDMKKQIEMLTKLTPYLKDDPKDIEIQRRSREDAKNDILKSVAHLKQALKKKEKDEARSEGYPTGYRNMDIPDQIKALDVKSKDEERLEAVKDDEEKVPMGLPLEKVPMGLPMDEDEEKVPTGLPLEKVPMGLPLEKVPMGLPVDEDEEKVPTGLPLDKVQMGLPVDEDEEKVPTGLPLDEAKVPKGLRVLPQGLAPLPDIARLKAPTTNANRRLKPLKSPPILDVNKHIPIIIKKVGGIRKTKKGKKHIIKTKKGKKHIRKTRKGKKHIIKTRKGKKHIIKTRKGKKHIRKSRKR